MRCGWRHVKKSPGYQKRTYEIRYNRLREELGWGKLSKLNLVIIQQAFNSLKSDTSGEDCKALLIAMLNRAMETDMLSKNPALKVNVKIDNEETEEKRVLTEDEIKILYDISKALSLGIFRVVPKFYIFQVVCE